MAVNFVYFNSPCKPHNVISSIMYHGFESISRRNDTKMTEGI